VRFDSPTKSSYGLQDSAASRGIGQIKFKGWLGVRQIATKAVTMEKNKTQQQLNRDKHYPDMQPAPAPLPLPRQTGILASFMTFNGARKGKPLSKTRSTTAEPSKNLPVQLVAPEERRCEHDEPKDSSDDDDDDIGIWPDATNICQSAGASSSSSSRSSLPINYEFLTQTLDAGEDVEHINIEECNVRHAFRNLQRLICDERLLLAHTLLLKLDAYLLSSSPAAATVATAATATAAAAVEAEAAAAPITITSGGSSSQARSSSQRNTDWVRIAMSHPNTRARLENLNRRVHACHEAFRLLASHDGWTYAQTHFGVTTHYRIEEDDGSLTVRLQGELKGCSVFDQLAVLREADLYSLWAPFVRASSIVKEVRGY